MEKHNSFTCDVRKLRTAKDLKGKIKELFSEQEIIDLAKDSALPHYALTNPCTGKEMLLFNNDELIEWINKNCLTKNECRVAQNLHFVYFDYKECKINSTIGVPLELQFIKELYVLPETVASTPAGVYFLCDEREIVYIGQSLNVGDRIQAHRSEKKKVFDRVFFITCHISQLCDFERSLIRRFKPKYNAQPYIKEVNGKDETHLSSFFSDEIMITGYPTPAPEGNKLYDNPLNYTILAKDLVDP